MTDERLTIEHLLATIIDKAAFLNFAALCAMEHAHEVPSPRVFGGLADICDEIGRDARRILEAMPVDALGLHVRAKGHHDEP